MTPALLEAILILAAKYGPEFITSVLALFQKKEITIADVEALFANVKPYEAYGIPTTVPAP